MKRTLLLVMTALLTIAASAEEVVINQVHFPDRNFREWLLQQPYGADGVITDAEINAITSLSVQSLGIKSLKGIGYFTALTELYCYGNQLDGNAMLQLSGELPSSVGETTFNLYAIDGKDSSEGNGLTTSIAYLLNDKGWKVYDRNGGEAVEIVGALPDKSTWLTLDDWATKSQRMPLDTTYTDATGTLKVKVNNQENKMKWDIDKRFWFENPLGIAELWEGTRLNTNTKFTTTNMVVTTPTAGYLYVYAYTGVPGRTLRAIGKRYIKQVELPNSKVDMQDADGTMRGSYPNTCIPVSVENAAAGVELTSPYGSIYICSIIFVPIEFESSSTPKTTTFTTEEGTKLTLQVISEDEKTAIITAADVAMGQTELTIPETANGYTITGIGDYAFYWNSIFDLLERITLPETIEEIGEWGFGACSKLKEINMPAALKSIGNSAFINSRELTSFNIPKSTLYIGDNCFSNCTKLASFTVDAANTHFTVQDGILYGTENGVPTTLVMYPMPKNDVTDFVVPSTVKKIQTLKNITSLETITLPDGIEEIVDMGLGCRSLKAIYLHPDNPYYTKQDGVLYDKSMQTLMLIPEGHQMETFTVPNGVTRIESGAIAYLQQLKVLNIPASVESLTLSDFYNYPCPALQAINVDEYNNKYSSIDGLLYEKGNGQYYLNCCPPARMGDVTIPDTGIRISCAFRNCQHLGTVEIPASAICSSRLVVNGNYYLGIFNNTKIEKLVIYSDDILNYDIYPERAAQILDLSTVIYVPENRVEACKASAGWGQYTIKSIDELTTGISSPSLNDNVQTANDHAPAYNLSGQRVGKGYKGIVIRNGRKIVVR